MTKWDYFLYLIERMESDANHKNLYADSSVNIDWGELQFIFSFVLNHKEYSEVVNSSLSCYICGYNTVITRPEQQVSLDNNQVKNKCLDCLIDQLQGNMIETEQLLAYWSFVRDNGLEEQFEYFLENLKSMKINAL